ncbi:hypothetical protein HYT53_00065 [Candidatus Woesearchaeota archaeon]|nr:hypothetical protein [Candidatus Woesearchaeota archaeon]
METEHDCCRNKDREGAGIKNIVLVGMVAAVLLLSVVQSFQIRTIRNQMTGNAAVSAGGVGMGGWTEDEKC